MITELEERLLLKRTQCDEEIGWSVSMACQMTHQTNHYMLAY